jgi:hypothetical protein
MDVVTIEYSRTRQVAQYEPENLRVVANLDSGENWLEEFKSLRNDVTTALFTAGAKAEAKVEEVKDERKKQTKTTKKKAATKKTATKRAKKEEPKAEESTGNTYEQADVKAALIRLIKARGRKVAEEVLSDHGYSHSSEVEEKDYANVINAADKLVGE